MSKRTAKALFDGLVEQRQMDVLDLEEAARLGIVRGGQVDG